MRFLVPPADAGALADAIAQLSGDKGLRRKFGEAGRRLVESEYSAKRVGSDIVTLYSQLLDLREIAECVAANDCDPCIQIGRSARNVQA